MKFNKEQIIIVFLIIAFSFYKGCIQKSDEEKLKNNGKIIIGKANYFFNSRWGGYFLSYGFNINNNTYKRSQKVDIGSEYYKIFENKRFPIIYLEDDLEVNRILILPSDFKKYGKVFPDSLKWVQKYGQ